jgi:uncharacterized membrane protein
MKNAEVYAGAALVGALVGMRNSVAPTPLKLVTLGVSGGFGGAEVCSAKKRSRWIGALLGAAGALGAAYGAYELRRRAAKKFNLPNPVVGLLADAAAAGAGMLVASRLQRQDN